ncbi:hypothetical protein [Allosphingosinicella deserti]|nr:hypothetical protein [Sphingomonas deserti]
MRAKRSIDRQIGIDADERVISAWRGCKRRCEFVPGDAVTFLAFPLRAGREGPSEVPWTNFSADIPLHKSARAGADFRERGRSKRQVATMRRKVERMIAPEGSKFVDWLARQYPEQVRRYAEEVA